MGWDMVDMGRRSRVGWDGNGLGRVEGQDVMGTEVMQCVM